MENPSLPTNPDEWPDNPWKLLGIAAGAGREEIRQAYVRLLRQYKPERDPQAFQKLRAAYEVALQYARYSATEEATPPREAPETQVASAQSSTHGSPAGRDRPSPVAADGSIRELATAAEQAERLVGVKRDAHWKQAVAGDGAAAIVGLTALRDRHPRDAEIVLRLYWVRKLFPAAGAAPAAEVLSRYLVSGSLADTRIMNLYLRELSSSIDEALDPRCRKVIAANLIAALRHQWIAVRWQAATATGRLSTIARDLAAWRKKTVLGEERSWAAVLHLALGHLRWGSHPKCEDYFERIRRELDDFADADFQAGYALDELDFMEDVWHGWCGLRHKFDATRRWPALLVASWCGSPALLRRKFASFLNAAGKREFPTLAQLDHAASESTAVVVQLLRGLERYRYEQAPELEIPYGWEHAPTRQLAVDLLRANSGKVYRYVRRALLTFCIEFAVPPDLIGELAEEAWPEDEIGAAEFAEMMAGDITLRIVWLANRLYWR